jgi:hypothetical protein
MSHKIQFYSAFRIYVRKGYTVPGEKVQLLYFLRLAYLTKQITLLSQLQNVHRFLNAAGYIVRLTLIPTRVATYGSHYF